MSTLIYRADHWLFMPSFLGWHALARCTLVCTILAILWLMVAWAVALP